MIAALSLHRRDELAEVGRFCPSADSIVKLRFVLTTKNKELKRRLWRGLRIASSESVDLVQLAESAIVEFNASLDTLHVRLTRS